MFWRNKKNRMLFFLGIAVCIGAIAWGFHILISKPNPPLPSTHVSIGGKTFTAELAQTAVQQARGLSGRDNLPENGGMLFIFPGLGSTGFWMKDMKFPIDIVWIRGDQVVGFQENMQPEPGKTLFQLTIYYPPEEIDKVLEINAGTVAKDGLKVGDTVVVN